MNMDEPQLWRYEKADGTPIWLPFNPAFPCLYCDRPVGALSTSGPAICPGCACGRKENGKRFRAIDYHHAKVRLEELIIDPVWDATEIEYGRRLLADHPFFGEKPMSKSR